jgi:hypothetical protein
MTHKAYGREPDCLQGSIEYDTKKKEKTVKKKNPVTPKKNLTCSSENTF